MPANFSPSTSSTGGAPSRTASFRASEVKDPVVWGQEVDGIQAGIVGPGPVRIGEKARFVVLLRNVRKEEITLSAWPLWVHSPRVVDRAGKPVRATRPPEPSFEIIPTKLTLKPGEMVVLEKANVFVVDADETLLENDVVTLEPGLYVAGVGGIRIEHNYRITAGGFRVCTQPTNPPEPCQTGGNDQCCTDSDCGPGVACVLGPTVPFCSGARISAYQPPPGVSSISLMPGFSPKNSRVCFGCRYWSRALFLSERQLPASTLSRMRRAVSTCSAVKYAFVGISTVIV